jgi:hypothetical protein
VQKAHNSSRLRRTPPSRSAPREKVFLPCCAQRNGGVAEGRGGVSACTVLKPLQYPLQHIVNITIDIFIPKVRHVITLGHQKRCPAGVIVLCVFVQRAINFDNQFARAAEEIDDERPDCNLAVEPVATEVSIAQTHPQNDFGPRHGLAHVSGMTALAIDLHGHKTGRHADSVAGVTQSFRRDTPPPPVGYSPVACRAEGEGLLLFLLGRFFSGFFDWLLFWRRSIRKGLLHQHGRTQPQPIMRSM